MKSNSKKYRYLAKNIGLLTLSSFSTKLLLFLLVPLYTNILTTTEYGINDLFYTTIGILVPVLTLNIQDAVMRFSLDTKYDNNKVLSVGLRYLVFGSVIVIAVLGLNYCFAFFEFQYIFKKYAVYFFLMFFSQALSGLITAYARGIDRIADLSVSSVINSVIVIASNILFLVVFKWGLIGYFWANIIGPILQCVYLIFRIGILKNFDIRKTDLNVAKEMKTYSCPMIINTISWWVNNASDKYIVIYFLGLAANGVYSVAAKIPSILSVLQSIFAQAWTLSAVKDYDPEDKNGFFAKTYATYNCAMTICCSVIIASDKILAKYLYAKDFFSAWKYAPWLTIAILFGAMSGYLGGLFSAVKDSKVFGRTTLMGAICNITLNLILVPVIGIIGAAIATTVSYCSVWISRMLYSKKYIKLKIKIQRDCFSYLLLVVQSVLLYYIDGIKLYSIEIILFLAIFVIYIKDVSLVLGKIKNVLVKKRKSV
ncbi:Membrane protein involved in the export of O-antigen and teichoic acid [Ruminococcus flavefaciens]|uniref:Membrane protein involved in the export of O-antigen and teichoic acid n=1 Tax=Ruminococcus flavefaciens TaxID=1265 RepID=A0A1H6II46_RUMFL|nr:polysaccharide biosynthesis C-terminal domain-containing protein [Ruminococcus flavefaciens]SEH46570.1 Membrane protein involved in the export of O-antigen and teichoic acid [Ruminococcus flavefaciens]